MSTESAIERLLLAENEVDDTRQLLRDEGAGDNLALPSRESPVFLPDLRVVLRRPDRRRVKDLFEVAVPVA